MEITTALPLIGCIVVAQLISYTIVQIYTYIMTKRRMHRYLKSGVEISKDNQIVFVAKTEKDDGNITH